MYAMLIQYQAILSWKPIILLAVSYKDYYD